MLTQLDKNMLMKTQTRKETVHNFNWEILNSFFEYIHWIFFSVSKQTKDLDCLRKHLLSLKIKTLNPHFEFTLCVSVGNSQKMQKKFCGRISSLLHGEKIRGSSCAKSVTSRKKLGVTLSRLKNLLR